MTTTKTESIVTIARRIVARKQYEKVDGVLLDMFTASAIVAVADALKTDASRERLEKLDVVSAASICMKLVA